MWIAALVGLLRRGCRQERQKEDPPPPTPLERYVAEAAARTATAATPSPGGIWSPGSRLADAARDPRASQVDDTVTILVVESASAVASGTTQTERASSTANTVSSLAGVTRATGPWANLAGTSGRYQAQRNRDHQPNTVINTTLTARVVAVMPSGALVVDASKDIQINSERQTITVRGVARPSDIGADNIVRSDRLAQLEVHVNGKGVVGDAIRRPFFLYRLLLGLLPF